ncbi:MAG: glutamate racemase [Ruminococcus sp.]|nr:glutamate racemase [Ruminococcus sp.]
MNNAAIGVFDSGVGGLSCVKELTALMPHEDIIYLGDTARVPYGTKSVDTIARYAKEDIAFLEKFNVKMILIACGTVSSVLMSRPLFEDSTVSEYSGVIYPTVAAACAATRNDRIGVIGTPATVRSGCYGRAIRELRSDIRVFSKACPMFVPLVENGYTDRDDPVAKLIAEEYLEGMKREGVDTLILGCTHYPHLEGVISSVMGSDVRLISSGAEIAKYAERTLVSSGNAAERTEKGTLELYCTDSEELFSENVETFLGHKDMIKISRCSVK